MKLGKQRGKRRSIKKTVEGEITKANARFIAENTPAPPSRAEALETIRERDAFLAQTTWQQVYGVAPERAAEMIMNGEIPKPGDGRQSGAHSGAHLGPPQGLFSRVRDKKRVFLAVLERMGGNMLLACEAAGVSRKIPAEWAAKDPRFAAAFEIAQESAKDVSESIAWKQAFVGNPRGVWVKDSTQNPVKVETLYETEPRLAELFVKAGRPEKFETRTRAEVSGPGGMPIAHNVQIVLPGGAPRLKSAEPKAIDVESKPSNT